MSPRGGGVGSHVRRFPAPWSIRELEQAFRIEDATGQAVAYTYFRKDENEARQAQVLTWDKARRIAANIAKLCPSCYAGRLKRSSSPCRTSPRR